MNFKNFDFQKITNDYLDKCNQSTITAVALIDSLVKNGIREPDVVDFVFDQNPFAVLFYQEEEKNLTFHVHELSVDMDYSKIRKNTKHPVFSKLFEFYNENIVKK